MAERKSGSGLSGFMQRQRVEPQAEKREKSSPKRRATKEGREQMLVYLFPEGIKELKLAAVEESRTVSSLVAEAVNEWLQKHGRPPVA